MKLYLVCTLVTSILPADVKAQQTNLMNKEADVHLYNVNTVVCMCNHSAVKRQQCILCAVELHVTVNYIKILSVTQQCCHGKFVNSNNANFTYQFLKEIIL